MTKEKIIEKLCSRKLWMAIIAFVALLIVALGGTEDEAAQVAALIMAGASVIAYIVGEGLVDAAEETTSIENYECSTVNNYGTEEAKDGD